MADALVTKPICSKCGEEARPQAAYCFACGGKVINPGDSIEHEVSSEWFKGEIVVPSESAEGTAAVEALEVAEESLEPVPEEPVPEEAAEAEEPQEEETKVRVKRREREKEPVGQASPMKTAADLRNRPKPLKARRVEIVWEEPESSPNVLFIVSGLILVLVALAAFFLAIYLK